MIIIGLLNSFFLLFVRLAWLRRPHRKRKQKHTATNKNPCNVFVTSILFHLYELAHFRYHHSNWQRNLERVDFRRPQLKRLSMPAHTQGQTVLAKTLDFFSEIYISRDKMFSFWSMRTAALNEFGKKLFSILHMKNCETDQKLNRKNTIKHIFIRKLWQSRRRHCSEIANDINLHRETLLWANFSTRWRNNGRFYHGNNHRRTKFVRQHHFKCLFVQILQKLIGSAI